MTHYTLTLAPHPADPARLRHRPAILPLDLLDALRRHRGPILGLLAGGWSPGGGDGGADARYVLGDRLGIADDLGIPTHPGAPAWLVAVGESMRVEDSSGDNLDTIHTVCYTKA